MFAIIWIIIWAFVFNIFDDPTTGQIWGFILIGLGGPIGRWLINMFRKLINILSSTNIYADSRE